MLLSIIIPIFNEEECLDALWRRLFSLRAHISNYDVEFVMVNDGSKDASLDKLRKLAASEPHLKVVSFSRNFGHQLAVSAGLDYCSGDAVIIMDADLQDPPEIALQMLQKFEQGYDVVYATRRARKGETLFKRKTAEWFYRALNALSTIPIPLNTGDFRLMSRRVVDTVTAMKEKDRFLRGMVSWVGFAQTSIEFERDERTAGETKYPLSKMIRFGLDGIISFSNSPLKLATWLGFLVSLASLSYIVVVLALKFAGHTFPGYASLMVAILFLGGIQLVSIGILGEYIGRIYTEEKNRPLYVVAETLNVSKS